MASLTRQSCAILLTSAATLLLGITVRGDWLLIFVYIWRQNVAPEVDRSPVTRTATNGSSGKEPIYSHGGSLADVHWYVVGSLAVSYGTFFLITGFLQWFYYIRQKDTPETWKCQPTRWLSAEDEKHEIILGSIIMGIGGCISGVVACYILNGGYTTMYFSVEERGWPYLLASLALVFVAQDCLGYHLHRLYHLPVLYRHIHKWHHRYRSPTAFSGTAMHPLEFVTYQASLMAPIFTIPIHSGAYIVFLLYVYYYGMIDHSGIKMEAVWPWQPCSMFHDDHHRYFHANFGFNLKIWDRLYGTLRREDRVYGEDIFGGKGRAKTSN